MRYTATARLLHWGTALAMLAIGILGLWLAWAAPRDEVFKLLLYNLHESLGMTVFLATLVRLGWRWRHPPPPIHPPLPRWMRRAAAANHAALYALLLAMPLVGLMATNAWGFPLTAFGLIPVPSPVGPDQALAPLLSRLHVWMALALGLLLLAHIGAALWHALVRRDDTLRRMGP
ncbi:cytochrome b [Teichococcus cervicalis]|uniref:Nickel-dependent hydrogenases B-type cytochrome subunit n=2 Tax=Teichococcus cervicalis TaxID=204525 RepID=D5RNK1_9PROT|nr:cytochrome b/b6 domain-containing protein [Pseudoroseomonas cervicalis]EFH11118.1 Nickel-dependent hydrogenases B-type cytochrome subunit [Pseudoroseomonas cervicalis ATCC 49957]